MSKLYQKYLTLKREEEEKLYLFENGIFYIFLAEDAAKVHEVLDLKCTWFTDEIMKCGFPKNSLNKYLERLEEASLEVQLIPSGTNSKTIVSTNVSSKVEKSQDLEAFVTRIKKMNFDDTTPMMAYKMLRELKEKLTNE